MPGTKRKALENKTTSPKKNKFNTDFELGKKKANAALRELLCCEQNLPNLLKGKSENYRNGFMERYNQFLKEYNNDKKCETFEDMAFLQGKADALRYKHNKAPKIWDHLKNYTLYVIKYTEGFEEGSTFLKSAEYSDSLKVREDPDTYIENMEAYNKGCTEARKAIRGLFLHKEFKAHHDKDYRNGFNNTYNKFFREFNDNKTCPTRQSLAYCVGKSDAINNRPRVTEGELPSDWSRVYTQTESFVEQYNKGYDEGLKNKRKFSADFLKGKKQAIDDFISNNCKKVKKDYTTESKEFKNGYKITIKNFSKGFKNGESDLYSGLSGKTKSTDALYIEGYNYAFTRFDETYNDGKKTTALERVAIIGKLDAQLLKPKRSFKHLKGKEIDFSKKYNDSYDDTVSLIKKPVADIPVDEDPALLFIKDLGLDFLKKALDINEEYLQLFPVNSYKKEADLNLLNLKAREGRDYATSHSTILQNVTPSRENIVYQLFYYRTVLKRFQKNAAAKSIYANASETEALEIDIQKENAQTNSAIDREKFNEKNYYVNIYTLDEKLTAFFELNSEKRFYISHLMKAVIENNEDDFEAALQKEQLELPCMVIKDFKETDSTYELVLHEENEINYVNALMFACWYGRVDFVKKLLENGANANAAQSSNYNTCLHTVLYGNANDDDKREIIKLFLQHNACFNLVNKEGECILDCLILIYRHLLDFDLCSNLLFSYAQLLKEDELIENLLQQIPENRFVEFCQQENTNNEFLIIVVLKNNTFLLEKMLSRLNTEELSDVLGCKKSSAQRYTQFNAPRSSKAPPSVIFKAAAEDSAFLEILKTLEDETYWAVKEVLEKILKETQHTGLRADLNEAEKHHKNIKQRKKPEGSSMAMEIEGMEVELRGTVQENSTSQPSAVQAPVNGSEEDSLGPMPIDDMDEEQPAMEIDNKSKKAASVQTDASDPNNITTIQNLQEPMKRSREEGKNLQTIEAETQTDETASQTTTYKAASQTDEIEALKARIKELEEQLSKANSEIQKVTINKYDTQAVAERAKEQHKAAIIIQSVVRGFFAKNIFKELKLQKHLIEQANTTIDVGAKFLQKFITAKNFSQVAVISPIIDSLQKAVISKDFATIENGLSKLQPFISASTSQTQAL